MNADQLKTLFPNASPDFISRNASAQSGQTAVLDSDTGKAPELERRGEHGTVGTLPFQKAVGGRFLVRVTAYRKRLLDEDNLCEKYHVDLCRYSGALPSDAAGKAKIEVCQQKVGENEPEETLIEIYDLQG